MKIEEFKLNKKVYDIWWPSWGYGTITKILKTRVRIKFRDIERTYDKEHFQFLKEK